MLKFLLAVCALAAISCFPPGVVRVDVCVYGGSSAGVMAAAAAAREGKRVILLEPSQHLGGMSSSGLGMTDIGNKHVIGGMAREFYRRVGSVYGEKEAWEFEPHVAEQTFNRIADEAGVIVVFGARLDQVNKDHNEIRYANFATQTGQMQVEAKIFIDCTYEGDLMAAAGVSYTIGRESSEKYFEDLNGIRQDSLKHQFDVRVDPYVRPGDKSSGLIPLLQNEALGKPGGADGRVQAYNYRLCLTRNPQNRIEIEPPEDYDPYVYELLARYIKAVPEKLTLRDLLQIDPVPNRKTDVNNKGPISTDFLGESWGYAEASIEERREIAKRHENYIRGFFHFLRTDQRIPARIRKEAAEWGLCKDEFTDNGGWPYYIYVREARRMVGRYVVTQTDIANTYVSPESIGMGAFQMDSHHCRRIVVNGRVVNEGDVQVRSNKPYPISYSAITPTEEECTNLLVPVCLSASHIAFCSIRMEPVFMILGQSAGLAACEAIDAGASVQRINVSSLQTRLAAAGQILTLHER